MSTCQLTGQLVEGSCALKNGAASYTVEGCMQRRRARRKSALDVLIDYMEKKDSAADRLIGYGICTLSLLYFGGHLVKFVLF